MYAGDHRWFHDPHAILFPAEPLTVCGRCPRKRSPAWAFCSSREEAGAMRSRRALWSLIFPVAGALAWRSPFGPGAAGAGLPGGAPVRTCPRSTARPPCRCPASSRSRSRSTSASSGSSSRRGAIKPCTGATTRRSGPPARRWPRSAARSPCAEMGHHHPGHPHHGRRLLLAGRLPLDVRTGRGARAQVRSGVPQDLPDLPARSRPDPSGRSPTAP